MHERWLAWGVAASWSAALLLTGVGIAGDRIYYEWGLSLIVAVAVTFVAVARRYMSPVRDVLDLGVEIGERQAREALRSQVVVPIRQHCAGCMCEDGSNAVSARAAPGV